VSPAARLRQVRLIAGLQLRRVFLARRSLWVYVLALFPALIFFGHGVEITMNRAAYAKNVTAPHLIDSLREGDTADAVLLRAGEPVSDRTRQGRTRDNGDEIPERRYMTYHDGKSSWQLRFDAGLLVRKDERVVSDFGDDRSVFAGVFQYFYLRLGVFFGCLGIFMNLFRGEMLDKTLHYWFLAPARRDILLLGKYVAGMVAATTIFTFGAGLCFLVMLWPQEPSELAAFWPDPGLSHLFWYCAATVLGCGGYGSVFLAAGVLLRNPIVPAAALLFWESINGFLPAMLQKVSILYYVQALTPVPVPLEDDAPLFIQLLMRPAAPPSTLVAVLGLLIVTAFVLWAAAAASRGIEIDYGTD
jgi:hypothetical protein